jgi:hypothetical protein
MKIDKFFVFGVG